MEEEKIEEVENEDLDIDDLEEDLESEESLDEGEATKKQTREENKRYAELRRQHEAEQKKVKELEAQNRILNDQIRYSTQQNLSDDDLEELGIEKVETEDELFLANEFIKAKSKGENNAAVYAYRMLRKKEKEEKESAVKKADEESQNKLIEEDVHICVQQFKKTPTEILKEKDFVDLFGEAIHNGNVNKLYSKYVKIKNAEKEAEEIAKKKAIPPLPEGKNDNLNKNYTNMNSSEKENYLRKIGLIN